MPIFEIQTPSGKVLTIEAADESTAMTGAWWIRAATAGEQQRQEPDRGKEVAHGRQRS